MEFVVNMINSQIFQDDEQDEEEDDDATDEEIEKIEREVIDDEEQDISNEDNDEIEKEQGISLKVNFNRHAFFVSIFFSLTSCIDLYV